MPANWIQTYRGRRVPLDYTFRAAHVDLYDIAWALAHTYRYNGHLAYPLSVARHSINIMRRVPEELRLTALLHDAAEAYIGDMPMPLKNSVVGVEFKKLEEHIEKEIARALGVPLKDPKVKEADVAILTQEVDRFGAPRPEWFELYGPRQADPCHVYKPQDDYYAFLRHARLLGLG